MPKGYKIDLSEYTHEWDEEELEGEGDQRRRKLDAEGQVVIKRSKTKVKPCKYLPDCLCSPGIGSALGEKDKDFDLYAIGGIAERIEEANQGDTPFIVLDSSDYEILKKRVQFVQKFHSRMHYKMFKRILDPEIVNLKEE